MSLTSAAASACQHCGLPVATGTRFCCAGCESVYSLLKSRGLEHFYDLKDRYSFKKPTPAAKTTALETFAFAEIELATEAKFYLEGIHCLGCLWLLEKLPEIDDRILTSDLEIAHQILTVKIKDGQIRWEEVHSLLSQLGYPAKPLRDATDGEKLRLDDQRKQLLRLGVAGFSAGNVMLLAVSIYGGADPWWSRHFGWLSLALSLPSLGYSAWPIYRSALGPLARGRISVDLAIALALLAGIAMSIWSLVRDSAHAIYFDSLTMLVFLLLTSRYLLARIRERLSKENVHLSVLSEERYRRFDHAERLVPAAQVRSGDTLVLCAGQTVPTDCRLVSEVAHLDLSLLTGESAPMKFARGDSIDSGSRVVTKEILVQATKSAEESRLAKILDQIKTFQLRRSTSVEFADSMGRYFVAVVLTLAFGTVLALPNEEGIRRALALVIVTCPCILAFAVPLTLTRALQIAARRGILFKDAAKLELLAKARNLFLDKTGTVTEGQYKVLRWEPCVDADSETRAAALALETESKHPVAKALVRYLSGTSNPAIVRDFAEIPGIGVRGLISGKEWKIVMLSEPVPAGVNRVGIYAGQVLMARADLGDAIRKEAPSCLSKLTQMGLQIVLLSGDREENVAATAEALNVKSWYARLLPEQKAELVSRSTESVMVGDGANDAVAFQSADIGIAVQGAMELSLRHSDVLLTQPGIGTLLEAVKLAKSTMRTVKTNFAITLSYNVVAGALALSGGMSPLVASILMPASAMSVFVLTEWRSQRGTL